MGSIWVSNREPEVIWNDEVDPWSLIPGIKVAMIMASLRILKDILSANSLIHFCTAWDNNELWRGSVGKAGFEGDKSRNNTGGGKGLSLKHRKKYK